MSLYLKAWLFMGSTVFLLLTLPYWQPLVEYTLGPKWSHLALLIWGVLGFTAYYLFSCRSADVHSLEWRGSFSTPVSHGRTGNAHAAGEITPLNSGTD